MVLYPLIGSRKDRALGDDAACLHKVALYRFDHRDEGTGYGGEQVGITGR
jgi:hypothetical protein